LSVKALTYHFRKSGKLITNTVTKQHISIQRF